MEPNQPDYSGLVFLLYPMLMIGVAFVVTLLLNSRETKVKRWAKKRGLDYDWREDWDWGDKFPDFDALPQQTKEQRYAKNLVTGSVNGVNIYYADFFYHPAWLNTLTSFQSVSGVVVELPFESPPLFIRPENMLDKASGSVGFRDIEFESLEFNRRFYVKCGDKKWAFHIIQTDVMELMLHQPRYCLYMTGRYMIVGKINSPILRIRDINKSLDLAVLVTRRLMTRADL